MRNIVRVTVGFRGLAGAIDFSTVTLATGAPGTEVTYEDGVLTIPRGNDGSGEGGSFAGVTVAVDGNLTGLGTAASPLALGEALLARLTALEQANGALSESLGTLAADLATAEATMTAQAELISALTARVAALEADMPQVQAFDTTAEATAFSNARPGNIGFSREV